MPANDTILLVPAIVPKSADTYGNLHFDLAAQRTFGARYGQAMLKLLGNQ